MADSNLRREIASALLVLCALSLDLKAQTRDPQPAPTKPLVAGKSEIPVDRPTVDRIVADWPGRPRLAANQMLMKYGTPQQATPEKLVWKEQGAFKRIMVSKIEIPHDFPKPHMDYMTHTIAYRIPAGKLDALIAFDGSVIADRTAGELSARCDLEGHNILTLNIAHDIIVGKKTTDEGRKAFGEIVVEDSLGKNPPYVMELQFTPPAPAADADTPVIPGSPVRPKMGENGGASNGSVPMDDAEVLCFVVAVNDGEILAASEVSKKKVDAKVVGYAKLLHTDHGKNLEETMKLGQQINVTPLETPAVDSLRVKHAGELAALVLLDGDAFAKAYLDAMVKGHTEVLELIDTKLLPRAQNPALKKHLEMTRGHIEHHLKEARAVQAGTK